MSRPPRPSLDELAAGARKVLVWGNGGGGDAFQGIPIANHLQRLGVGEVILGGVSGAWMTADGHVPTDPATVLLGAEIFALDELTETIKHADQLVEVSATTRLRGRQTAEAVLVEQSGRRAVVIGLGDGVPAARRSLESFVKSEGIDIVVASDIGSDTFFSGEEPNPAKTAFVDFLSLGVLLGAPCARVFGLGGYGLDGELLEQDLERNIGRVAAAGGYLGAIGVTQRDVIELEAAIASYADPVGVLVPVAARGGFGWHQVATGSPWGTPVRVSPLAAVTLFFDPEVMVAEVCRVVEQLAKTATVAEAEDLFESLLGVVPETRLLTEAALRAPRAG
ncbi:DUF1152 domain-containing protein [Dactylosporangium sp. CA-233914]|uniref:DUF1152 domain-containing protein n=1 Tax=Dactylosporangium sp. CA-233914 TaxID=3239934 RepID=UPI003D92DF23